MEDWNCNLPDTWTLKTWWKCAQVIVWFAKCTGEMNWASIVAIQNPSDILGQCKVTLVKENKRTLGLMMTLFMEIESPHIHVSWIRWLWWRLLTIVAMWLDWRDVECHHSCKKVSTLIRKSKDLDYGCIFVGVMEVGGICRYYIYMHP